MHVVLHQVRWDSTEHREAAGDARSEGHRRGLVRLEGDDAVSKLVEIGQGHACEHRIRVDRARDCVVAHVKLAQFLTQELIAANAHAADTHDLLEELNRVLFSLRILLGDRFAQLSDAIGGLSCQLRFAACVEHDLSAVFFKFAIDAELVEVVAHLVPLHSVVTSIPGLDTQQL